MPDPRKPLVWLWTSTGGCQYCDAMAGYHYGEEPQKIHPNCVCEIIKVNDIPWNELCFEFTFNIDKWTERRGGRWVTLSQNNRATQENVYVEISYTIDCIHEGKTTSGKFKLVQKRSLWKPAMDKYRSTGDTKDAIKLWNKMISDIEARIDTIARSFCKCTGPLIA